MASVVLRDDFQRSDGAPGIAPSGHVWGVTGGNLPVVTSGRLVNASGAAGYAYTDLVSEPLDISVQVSWAAGTTTSPVFVIVSNSTSNGGLTGLVHLYVGPGKWNLQLGDPASFVTPLGEVTTATQMALDGTVYTWKLSVNGSTATVTDHLGAQTQITHALIRANWGRYVMLETLWAAGNAQPRFESVTVSGTDAAGTVSRATIIARMAARFGGHAGTITGTPGVSTAAILNGQIGTSDDDSRYVGWHLFMLDAANENDKERTVTGWNAASGVATWDGPRTDTMWTAENYILTPDYSLDEYRQAINQALRNSKRTQRYRLPIVPGLRHYGLSQLTWLEGADDVDAVWVSGSPNWLHNEDFEFWHNGSALAPDGWTLGGGATIARSATGIRSPYAATVIRASGIDATLYQDMPPQLVQHLTRSYQAPLPLLAFGAWIVTSTAAVARVGLYNGATTAWTGYHTGSGVPQFLESTYQTTAVDAALRLVQSVDTTNASASFHAAVLARDAIPEVLRDRGSNGYSDRQVMESVSNQGGLPVIDYASPEGGSLVVVSLRPHPEMTADTDVVEDRYADTIVAGALRYITDAAAPNIPQERLGRVRGEEAAKWTRALEKNQTRPVKQPATTVRVGGA